MEKKIEKNAYSYTQLLAKRLNGNWKADGIVNIVR